MSAQPRRATTILLVRSAPERPSGIEIFMVQRHRRSGFLPNAWVFPGGRVDDADAIAGHPRLRGGKQTLQRIALDPERGVPFLVAGVRETFEEAGIWLGQGDLPEDARDALNRGETTLAQVIDAHDTHVDLDEVVPWSWWVTPEAEPRRYDTLFLLARAYDYQGVHDNKETVNSGWFCPREILRDARIDSFPMAPPTWWTLHELAAHTGIEPVFSHAHQRRIVPIQPIMRFEEQGMELWLPGHPNHPVDAVEGLPPLVRYDNGRWVAEQDGREVAFDNLWPR